MVSQDSPGDSVPHDPTEPSGPVRWRLRHRGWYLALDTLTISSFFAINIVLLRIIHGGFNIEFAFSALIAMVGFVIGAVVSLIFTPYTLEERRQWSNLSSVLAGALAGYGLKTVSDLVNHVLTNTKLLTSPVVGTRIAVFVVWLGFAIVYGFTYRRYYVRLDLTPDSSDGE